MEQTTEHNQNKNETESERDVNLSNEIIEMLKADKERLISELDELKKDKREQEKRFHDEKQSFHSLIREEKNRSQLLQLEIKKSESEEKFDNGIKEDKKVKWYDVFKKTK